MKNYLAVTDGQEVIMKNGRRLTGNK